MAKESVTAKVIDFSNVKEGGGAFNTHRVPEGDYRATIVKVEDATSKKDDTFQYVFTIKLTKYSQYAYPYYCKLAENQLWKLRNLAIAAGLNVPKKRMKFDPSKVVGKSIGVTMEDDEYEGKLKSTVSAIFPVAELVEGNEVDEDDEDAITPDDDDNDDLETEDSDDDDVEDDAEEDEEETEDEFAGMDRTALKAWIKANGDDPSWAAKKSQSDDDLRELARGILDTAKAKAGDPDEDDEDDEPEPAPKPAKKAATKKGKKAKAEVTDEELEELDIDEL